MKAFEQFTGLIAPMDRANVDTDQIIPKQFLKSIKRTGFGDNLFDAWRYLDEGGLLLNMADGTGRMRNLLEFAWKKIPLAVVNVVGPRLRGHICL